MHLKELKVEFRYLMGNIACMSITSETGKPINNDINDEDAIKMFNALIGSKENSIIQENKKYKEVIDKAINDLNIIIDIVREQPLGSDCWIIDRLEANKSILKGADND